MEIHVSFSIEIAKSKRSENMQDSLSNISWGRLRHIVKRRDGATCYYCGRYDSGGHVDHKIPLVRGGDDSLDNLVWSCAGCNTAKSDKTADEYIGLASALRKKESTERAGNIVAALPIAPSMVIELARGILSGALTWSRKSLVSTGMTGTAAREVQHMLEDFGVIDYPEGGKRALGAQTTELGRRILKSIVDTSSEMEIGADQ